MTINHLSVLMDFCTFAPEWGRRITFGGCGTTLAASRGHILGPKKSKPKAPAGTTKNVWH